MVIVNLRDLMIKKGAIEGKKITYKDIEEFTGIKNITLSRIANKPNYNIKTKHIEKLCKYFDCSIDQLFTIIPDKKNI